jgi:aminoglycoside phosphotransferase (APT) family kinase protein
MDHLRRAVEELVALEPTVSVVGPAEGGMSGAFLLRDDRDSQWVAKLVHNPYEMTVAQVRLSEVLRRRGYPLSEHADPRRCSNGDLVLQRWVRGDVRQHLTMPMAREMVRLNGLLADVASDPALVGFGDLIKQSLTSGIEGYCSHEPLRRHSDLTRRLLAWVLEVGVDSEDLEVPACDAVHYDFHHLNVLWRGDVAAAVIDWDGSRVGDRFFDLVTLGVDASSHTSEDVLRYLRYEIASNLPVERVRLYVAHMLVRAAVWITQHRPPDVHEERLRESVTWMEWVDGL